MSNQRLSSRRQDLQRRMKKASNRIVRNGKELERALKEWTEAAHEDCLLAFLERLADCYSRLVERTPVDTGRARAGWHIEGGLNEWAPAKQNYPRTKREKPLSKLPPLTSKEREAVSSEIAKLQDLSKADVIYIMNNVEYMLPLEAGYSRQSSGFWALFMKELSSQLAEAAQRSRKGSA